MANAHTFGTVAATDLLPGRGLRSTPIVKMGGVYNYHLGNGAFRCKILHIGVPDAFAAGIASIPAATGATSMLAADVRIPRISTAHVSLHCRARVTVAGAGIGRVDFISRGTPDTLTLSSVAAGPVDLEGDVDFSIAAAYDDIGIELQTQAGTTLVVHSIEVWYVALANPIPAGTAIGSAQAFGVTSLGPDYPHDAGLNDAFVDALEAVRAMPRVLFCAVAIATAVGGDGALRDRVHQTWATIARGALRAGAQLTVWANGTRPAAPASSYLYLQLGTLGTWPNPLRPVLFNADGWKSGTFDLPSDGAAVVDTLPVPSMFVGVWPATAGNAGRGRTTTLLKSITVWGE
jgi:hypothetical protein